MNWNILLEGTCINNEGVFMFKKGSFELGATVYPVAMKVGLSDYFRVIPLKCLSASYLEVSLGLACLRHFLIR